MAKGIYRVTLERHNPFKQIIKYVAADNIKTAWELAQTRGAEFNSNIRKNPCVVYGVHFTGEYQQ